MWGAHNPLDVGGGAAVGLAIAAVLDLILDFAPSRGHLLPRADRSSHGGSVDLSIGVVRVG